MSVFKTTFSRALTVIPSNNSNVPYPSIIKSGTNSSVSVGALVDSTANFNTLSVAAGDIVYNVTDGTTATVIQVVNATTLLLNADIFTAPSASYVLYAASAQTTVGNQGCFLYVGGSGNVKVTTIGQDVITFSGITAGTVLPVQVIKVHAAASGTTATLINALW